MTTTAFIKKKKRDDSTLSSYLFSNSPNAASSRDGLDNETGTESVISHRRDRHRRRNREGHEDGESYFIFPLFPLERTILLIIFQSNNYTYVNTAEEKCVCILA